MPYRQKHDSQCDEIRESVEQRIWGTEWEYVCDCPDEYYVSLRKPSKMEKALQNVYKSRLEDLLRMEFPFFKE